MSDNEIRQSSNDNLLLKEENLPSKENLNIDNNIENINTLHEKDSSDDEKNSLKAKAKKSTLNEINRESDLFITKSIKESSVSSDNFMHKNEKELISLDEKDFISTTKKESIINKIYIENFIFIFIYVVSYVFCAIYIRHKSYNLDPSKASLIQGGVFSVFIPFSFFISITSEAKKQKKTEGREREISNVELEINMDKNLSDFMEKKYYEIYFRYLSKFYIFTGIISALYYLSFLFFYLGINNCQNIYGQIFVSFISTMALVPKLFDRGIRCNLFNIISIFLNFTCSCIFMIWFILDKNNYKSNNDFQGTLFLTIFVLFYTAYTYMFRKIFKKYFYYIETLEFVGYMGIFILIIIPLVLSILYCANYTYIGKNNPQGVSLFYVLGKSLISSFICDLSYIFVLKYFSLGVISKVFNINLGVLCLLYYLFRNKDILIGENNKANIVFYVGEGTCGLVLFLFFLDIYKKKNKKQKKVLTDLEIEK